LFIVFECRATEERDGGLVADATIEKDPPIEVARCDVEDRGVRWLRAEASLGLGKSARPDDLHVARDQATHQPTHEIGTVNKK